MGFLRELALSRERIVEYAMISIATRESSNIFSLATYMKRVADAGYIGFLLSVGTMPVVAPSAGRTCQYFNNPIAFVAPGKVGVGVKVTVGPTRGNLSGHSSPTIQTPG